MDKLNTQFITNKHSCSEHRCQQLSTYLESLFYVILKLLNILKFPNYKQGGVLCHIS
jgi:hypothetical protein